MKLNISEKSPTICLNMIVKNESHIIKNTLEKLCNKINFDYWVICDTGSTDNTPQIIMDFFKEKSIKGELFYDEWVNFAHNRTLALQRAYKKTQLLLIFDADDEIVGNIQIPTNTNELFDEYHFKFGSEQGTMYTRVLLINNHKKFEFLSVIHEFLSSKESSKTTIINGDYHVVSGRTGNRSLDPDKYLKDALILEKAYKEAVASNDFLFHRYAYYCGNSYRDCSRFEDAIKWYKITLGHEKQWEQEKYTACLYMAQCYRDLNQEDAGFFYLVKAFKYDSQRVDCLYPLLVHYCCENMFNIAYNYYLIVKDFFENKYLNCDMTNKLFINIDKFNFFVPYYMILIADKVQDFKCVVRMYEIIFTKKQPMFDVWFIKNLLYNLQFFFNHVSPDNNKNFINLANNYIDFLYLNKINIQMFDFLKNNVYINNGLNIDKYFPKPEINFKKFSKKECILSKNILIYTGFMIDKWNYSFMLNNALGGSEKAVAYISRYFPKDYNIFISGDVKYETIENITYVPLNNLKQLIEDLPFNTVIVSRYISFYEMFKECSFYQSYIWAHDIYLLPYGTSLDATQIINKWNNYINGCICLTEWHKELFIQKYPILTNKINIINNGIDINSFKNINNNNKIKNKFIYTSRPDRGLNVLLNLWPQILEKMPDATLSISNYGTFPSSPQEQVLKQIIDKTDSITYLGQLQVNKLYEEMSSAEYWLYPTHWPETSCITALEMLMSEVICLYYPIAGLPYTIDKYGIQVAPNTEINTIISLTDEQKTQLRTNGKLYATSCCWSERAKIWSNIVFNNNNIVNTFEEKENNKIINIQEDKNIQQDKNIHLLLIIPVWYVIENILDYIDSLNTIYNVTYTQDLDYAITLTPNKVLFVFEICDDDVCRYFINQNIEVSILNTEPLNLENRFINIINNLMKYPGIKLYDYSKSNIKILHNNTGYTETEHLNYQIYEKENNLLKKLNECTPKLYDFGIILRENPSNLKRRRDVVNFLIENNYSIRIIQGWKNDRDEQIASCRVLLNIHGANNVDAVNNDEVSKVFEHIRCDRLLAAGYKILSESSLFLDENFINHYKHNLKIVEYNEFLNKEFYDNLDLNFSIKEQSNKIIECFIFYNEIDMLTYRLNVLNDVVDYFILVEAKQSFVGNPKPLFFNENKHLFDKFSKKIIHIIVELPFDNNKINIVNGEQWKNEHFQRNSISYGLDKIKNILNDNDSIIISDVDEIPDPKILFKIKNGNITNDISTLEQDFYYYNLNSKRNEYWYFSKIITYKKYKELNISCNSVRFLNGTIVKNGGWHLSYFGNVSFIKNKLENFSHQEYNSNTFTDTENIEEKINKGIDLFNRDNFNNSITHISINDNPYLPPLYQNYLTSFYIVPNQKIFCVIHSCTVQTTGTDILDYIVNVINQTGFIDRVDNVFINNIGLPIENKYQNNKYIVTNYSDNTQLFEYPSLNNVKTIAQNNPDSNILYLHTKGICHKHSNGVNYNYIKDWVNMMLYFLIEKHSECINKLNEGYDTVGCNYNYKTSMYPAHFSGNFWWSKSTYINKLHLLDENNVERPYSEFWLFTENPSYYIMHSSQVNHYHSEYPMEKYSQNSIIKQIINNV